MKNPRNDAPLLPRGRIAGWTKERLDKLSTDDLLSLLANAQKLNETEVATLCNQILDTRPGIKARRRKLS